MTKKMTLLYVGAVGQVAAALTRTGAPEAQVPAADFTGAALAVRWEPGKTEFAVPSAEIASVVVDRDDAVLFKSREYRVVDGAAGRLSAKKVDGVKPPTAQGIEVTVDAAPQDLPVPATEPVDVWVLFQDGAATQPVVATARIAVDKNEVFLNPALDSGTYDVLAMAADYQPLATSITVP